MNKYIVAEYIPAQGQNRATNQLSIYSTNESILADQKKRGLILDYKEYQEGVSYTIEDNKINGQT